MTLPAYAMNRANFPEMYERWLVEPLFRPWAEILLERVELALGDRVIDLACGTGIVARLAKDRVGEKGRVVGVDVSPQMLAVARAIAPTIDWREGNANALPVGDEERFDVVVCQQGLQFFPDKPAAAREMRRVLAPGGRLVVATWRPIEEVPMFRDLQGVAERHVGAVVDQRHSYGDATAIEKLLADAGFHSIHVETMSRTIRLAEAAVFVRMNTMAVVGMSAAGAAMGDEARAQVVDAIVNESAEVLPPYADGQGLAFELSTNVATARG
jgi:ubiquinone/menaquinone biosynthesis C-methylase UbiE